MGIQEAAYYKQYRETHKEELKEARRRRYLANPEKFKQRAKEQAVKYREQIRSRHKRWRDRNKEKIKSYRESFWERHGEKVIAKRNTPESKAKASEYGKQWRTKNPELVKSLNRASYEKRKGNPERLAKQRKYSRNNYYKDLERGRAMARVRAKRRLFQISVYQAKKRREDVQFAIKDRLRASINRALRRCGVMKSKRTMEMIGCSVEDLKLHVEKQFVGEMSWENRKIFHLDHHIPIAAFRIEDDEERLLAFNWKNIRPLLCQANAIKSDTLPNPLPDWLPVHIAERIKSRAISSQTPTGQSPAQ